MPNPYKVTRADILRWLELSAAYDRLSDDERAELRMLHMMVGAYLGKC